MVAKYVDRLSSRPRVSTDREVDFYEPLPYCSPPPGGRPLAVVRLASDPIADRFIMTRRDDIVLHLHADGAGG